MIREILDFFLVIALCTMCFFGMLNEASPLKSATMFLVIRAVGCTWKTYILVLRRFFTVLSCFPHLTHILVDLDGIGSRSGGVYYPFMPGRFLSVGFLC